MHCDGPDKEIYCRGIKNMNCFWFQIVRSLSIYLLIVFLYLLLLILLFLTFCYMFMLMYLNNVGQITTITYKPSYDQCIIKANILEMTFNCQKQFGNKFYQNSLKSTSNYKKKRWFVRMLFITKKHHMQNEIYIEEIISNIKLRSKLVEKLFDKNVNY